MGLLIDILKDLFGGMFSRQPSPEERETFKRRMGKRSAEAILSEKWVWQDHESYYEGEPDVRVNRKGQRSVSGKLSLAAQLTVFSELFGIDSEKIGKLEAEYRETVKLNPNNAGLHNNLGFILSKGNKQEEAESEYKRALSLEPDNPELHNNFGAFLFNQERYAEAEAEFKEAIWLNPNKCQFHTNAGRVLFLQDKLEEAEAEFKAAMTFTDYENISVGCEEILKEIRQRR